MGHDEDQLIASSMQDRRSESVVLAKAVSTRKLSLNPEQKPPNLDKIPSTVVQRKTSTSLKRISSSSAPSPLRRPSTAVSTTHSRIHQALRRSESEFVFSSKAATVDGFLYTSRFQQNASIRPSSSQPRAKPKSRANPKSPPKSPPSNRRTSETGNAAIVVAVAPSSPQSQSATPWDGKTGKPRPLSSTAYQLKRSPHQNQEPTGGGASPSKLDAMASAAAAKLEEAAFLIRKRRCACTFEEMILARIHGRGSATSENCKLTSQEEEATSGQSIVDTSNDAGVEKLLADGIVQSVLALSSLSDQATQSHCCRALYYLSQVRSARKPMVAQGVTTAMKSLVRTATLAARQDIAAMLCHLCEEVGLVEAMFFEGIDRCLVRLVATNHNETKRMCALAVFNISSDATKIKHFVEPFSQLLVTATRCSYGHTAASSYLMKAVYNVALLPMFHTSLLGENIPRFLVSQLPHVADEIKIVALQALISLCDVKANRAQILSQVFCQLLEKMLTVSNGEVQEMALLVLLLLSTDEGSRIKLCNWVPAATIVRTAATRLVPSAQMAPAGAKETSLVFLDSCILRNLCDNVLTHHELLEEGAVPLLLQMSRFADHDIKSNAVSALVSIIASSPEESAEYVVEIIDELLTLSRSPAHRICLFAVGAIYNISCNDDCLPLLLQSTDLIDRLKQLAEAPPHESVAELTAAIIYRLATTIDLDFDLDLDASPPPQVKTQLLTRGFFLVLVKLIREFPVARTYAVNALYLLAADKSGGGDANQSPQKEQNESPPFPHGTDEIWQLVCALSHDNADHKAAPKQPHGDGEQAFARSAVTLIAQLASQRVNHGILVKNGLVFKILRNLRHVTTHDHQDETIVMNMAFVFFALTVSQEGCEQLIHGQGIHELIHLARTTKLQNSALTHRVKELFMMTMCRISSFIGLEVRLIEHGAIDAVMVLALVSSTDSTPIKTLCIKILANCLVAKNCSRPLIEHGVIWALSSLATVESVETRYACAVSLCNLATVPHMLARFLDAGAPRALLYLLQKCHDDAHTAIVVIKGIANLVANEKICMALVNEDIEKHLGVFFTSPQSTNQMRQLAAMILLRVTSANDAVISLDHLKHGVFVWMEQIIAMEDDALVKNCMLTVHDLTCSTTIDVAELDVDHVLRIVIQVLHRHAKSGDVLTLCLWILYNLSCQLTVLSQLVRPEIFQFLRNQIAKVTLPYPLPSLSTLPSSAASSSVASVASVASPKLMSASSSMALLNGAIAQSVVAATAQSLDVKLCCLILHNLSCSRDEETTQQQSQSKDHAKTKTNDNNSSVLASLVNAHAVAILSDVYLQRDDLKETCAVAVCNLAVGKINSARLVEDRAGDLVIHFVFSALFHRCHYHLVSVAIRKMVNAPGNQFNLLARGIGCAIIRVLELVDGSDLDTIRNLMAALSALSKCKSHLHRLLQDGTLPIVIAVSGCKGATAGSSSKVCGEILGYCFEILSDLCTVDFEKYTKNEEETEDNKGDPINVINTLTRLSEFHQSTAGMAAPGTAAVAPCSYYDRGDEGRTPLAFAQLLTFMKKTPAAANSVKKNLELQATFQVPSRKWLPDAHPTPQDPPPLECLEIPLTEGSQAIPIEIKQRIKALATLGKEKLVRDDTSETNRASGAGTQQGGEGASSPPETDDDAAATTSSEQPATDVNPPLGGMPMVMGSRHSTVKKLQRGLAGRHFSRSGAMTASNSLLL